MRLCHRDECLRDDTQERKIVLNRYTLKPPRDRPGPFDWLDVYRALKTDISSFVKLDLLKRPQSLILYVCLECRRARALSDHANKVYSCQSSALHNR